MCSICCLRDVILKISLNQHIKCFNFRSETQLDHLVSVIFNYPSLPQESEFLRHLATMEELEPRASDRVLVWHTRTERAKLGGEKVLLEQGKPPSDAGFEV